MDHLHFPDTNQTDPEVVPFYEGWRYDGGDFATYLARHGVDEEQLIDDSVLTKGEPDSDHVLKFIKYSFLLQEWLFFGVLSEFARVFDVEYDRNDFCTDIGEGKGLTTKALLPLAWRTILRHRSDLAKDSHPAILKALEDLDSSPSLVEEAVHNGRPPPSSPNLARRLSASICGRVQNGMRLFFCPFVPDDVDDCPGDVSRQERITACLVKATRVLNKLWNRSARDDTLALWDVSLWISARILSETLARISELIIGCKIDLEAAPQSDEIWFKRARSAGRCKSRIKRIMNGTMSDAYFASTLKDNRGQDHDQCAFHTCAVRDKQFTESEPKHRPGCNRECGLVELSPCDLSQSKNLLERGSYPVMTLQPLPSGTMRLAVVDAVNDKAPYVAISHVWSHGMGNPNANALPGCQVAFIEALLSFFPMENKTFWIDTLCVPIEDPHRRLAISKMQDIYKNAAAVVAVDEELLKVGQHPSEKLFKLLMSDWMTRLWTFQEGILGDERLHVAFSQSVSTVRDIINEHESTSNLGVKLVRHNADVSALAPVTDTSSIDRLLELIQNIHRRKTTKKEDEALCLATLTGVDILELPKTPTLVDVLEAQDRLPQDILFAPGRRSKEAGFQWSPTTFLNQSHKQYSPGQLPAILNGHAGPGLQVRKRSLRISSRLWLEIRPETGRTGPRVAVEDASGKLLRVFHIDAADGFVEEQVTPRWIESPALVFEKTEFPHPESSVAVLVSNVREKCGIRRAHFEVLVETVDPAVFLKLEDPLDRPVTTVQGHFEETNLWGID